MVNFVTTARIDVYDLTHPSSDRSQIAVVIIDRSYIRVSYGHLLGSYDLEWWNLSS